MVVLVQGVIQELSEVTVPEPSQGKDRIIGDNLFTEPDDVEELNSIENVDTVHADGTLERIKRRVEINEMVPDNVPKVKKRLWDKVIKATEDLGPCGVIGLVCTPLVLLLEVPWVYIPGFSGFCYALYENDRSTFGRVRKLLNIGKRTIQSTFLCPIVVCGIFVLGGSYGILMASALGLRLCLQGIWGGFKLVIRLLTC
jgi:hypothetical protein